MRILRMIVACGAEATPLCLLRLWDRRPRRSFLLSWSTDELNNSDFAVSKIRFLEAKNPPPERLSAFAPLQRGSDAPNVLHWFPNLDLLNKPTSIFIVHA